MVSLALLTTYGFAMCSVLALLVAWARLTACERGPLLLSLAVVYVFEDRDDVG